jgi:hypothetical protein
MYNNLFDLKYNLKINKNKVEIDLLPPAGFTPSQWIEAIGMTESAKNISLESISYFLTNQTNQLIEHENKLKNLKKANQTPLIKKARLNLIKEKELLSNDIVFTTLVIQHRSEQENQDNKFSNS